MHWTNYFPKSNSFRKQIYFSSPFSDKIKVTAARTPATIFSVDAILFYTGISEFA